MMDDPEWVCPEWYVIQHAAQINFIPFWSQAGLDPPGKNDPMMTIFTNIANDFDWATKMAEKDKYDARND